MNGSSDAGTFGFIHQCLLSAPWNAREQRSERYDSSIMDGTIGFAVASTLQMRGTPTRSECKREAIRHIIEAQDLESALFSTFRNFAFDGEIARDLVYFGLESIFVDSQAPDFRLEGRIGDAEARRCTSWS